ncbi:radical SAM protein (plasmid) [Nitratireductor sp. GISD-1A_MAKvit]|uniref:radical SAM protein n=1 Tax=Nitratireductor sp. GISD-1A_MAKvit TaxID=3234198 RepID=UPI00346535B1
MSTAGIHDAIDLKIQSLADGVYYDAPFLKQYASNSNAIGKRRAYGNSDRLPADLKSQKVPPEFSVGPFAIAVNYSARGQVRLVCEGNRYLAVTEEGGEYEVSFTETPRFYNASMSNGQPVQHYATVYGRSTLGFFTPGVCYYFAAGTECHFCSLKDTRKTLKKDISHFIKPQDVREAIERIAELDPGTFNKVMLNGGNLKNHDNGFLNHIRIVEEIRETCDRLGLTIHLITMPPVTTCLIDEAKGLIDKIVFDPEIYDEALMHLICQGKAEDFGRAGYERSFLRAIDALGVGKVHAGLIAGFESIDSLSRGFEYYGAMGVIPAVNIFHPDPGTTLENLVRPTQDFIRAALEELTKVYHRVPGATPFLPNSGRNAIDTEAYEAAKYEKRTTEVV